VRSTRENRRFSCLEKVAEDFFHGQLTAKASRRGAVLVMVVACLAVVSLIAATMLEGAVRARRHWRLEQRSRQIDCLLDAAERHGRRCVAEARLDEVTIAVDLSPTQAAQSETARAMIRILFTPEGEDRWRVKAVVEWPPEGPGRPPTRRSRSFSVRNPPETPADPSDSNASDRI
jgi:type II secretory pathway pseudopilin PulG